MNLRRYGWTCVVFALVGCGDDTSTDDAGTAQTSAASQTSTDATSSAGDTSGAGETSTAGTTSSSDADTTESATTSADSSAGDIDVPCGDPLVLTCTGGDVCVEDVFDPECTNLEDPEDTCPDGQEMTVCGGAGLPCCCLPPPDSEWRCVTPTGCDGPASCECLGEVCSDGRACTSRGADPEHRFRCESLPKP